MNIIYGYRWAEWKIPSIPSQSAAVRSSIGYMIKTSCLNLSVKHVYINPLQENRANAGRTARCLWNFGSLTYRSCQRHRAVFTAI